MYVARAKEGGSLISTSISYTEIKVNFCNINVYIINNKT
jgi:hypothetical protein